MQYVWLYAYYKKIAFADMVVSQEAKIGDKYLPEIYIQAFNEVTSNPLI